MVKKTLIFHFYIPEGYKKNIAVRMNLECLKKYSHIFNSAIFTISGELSFANEAKKDLIDCGFSEDIRFIEVENTPYYEAKTFKDFVIDRIADYDGLVFFGHMKGVSDVVKRPDTTENIMMWIYGLYFYSLEFANAAEDSLIKGFGGNVPNLWGPFCVAFDEGHHSAFYNGTFFWLNPKGVINDINSGLIKIPQMSNRCFAENFPFIYDFNGNWGRMASLGFIYLMFVNFHECNLHEVIKTYGFYDEFMNGYKEVIKQIWHDDEGNE